jgi:succinate-semialdehyde dehydrogenase
MTAFRQELFGPVAAITVAKDAEHALALANDSDFGLSATVFTASDALAENSPASWSAAGCLSMAIAPAMRAWPLAA